jgi:hypothetical protein
VETSIVKVTQIALVDNLFVLALPSTGGNTYYIYVLNKSTGAKIYWKKFSGLSKLDAAAGILLA